MFSKKNLMIAGGVIVALGATYYVAKGMVIAKIAELKTPDGMKITDGATCKVTSVDDKRKEDKKVLWSQGDSLFTLLGQLKSAKEMNSHML